MKIEKLERTTVHVEGWLRERFGDHYAQISTDTSMKLKSAIKDVCRVMRGEVTREIHQLCSRLPDPPQGISDHDFVHGYEANEEHVPGILESDATLQEFVRQYPKEWEVVVKCLGLVRQKSRHACAYVICAEPVTNFIPTQMIGGVECTAYTASAKDNSIEAAGGLKMDFLVVNALNDIAMTVKLIQQRYGKGRGQSGNGYQGGDEFLGHDFKLNDKRVPGLRVVPHKGGSLYDIWDLPEDQGVFREICEQHTETVFQFNTPGCKKWLKYFDYEKEGRPGHKALDSIEALAAFTALDRPGPLDAFVGERGNAHNMLVEYSLRARGEESTGNLLVLDQMLPETYGVIVYQEQLQRVFQQIAETDGIVANSFRDHVAKKKMAEVIKDRDIFMPKAKLKLGDEVAEQLWGQLYTFGQYGFNLAHATCYVIIGYACAWLKHHYPLEWWCAVLRNADRKEINEKFWEYCGHLVDLPDIKHSGDQFEIQGDRIRAPLSLLQGIGPAAHQEICEERPFQDIDDFCQKIEARKVRLGEPCINRTVKKKKDRKTGEVTEIVTESPGVKKARSAITKGTMATLIVSGAADGLFPADAALLDKLSLYLTAHAKAQGLVRKDGSVKADPVPEKFLSINQYGRFQMRKKMLPGWSGSLLPIFLDMRVPGVVKDGKKWSYKNKFPFVTAKTIEYLNAMPILPKKQTVAMAAYVVSDRRFSYQDGSKTAAELVLDVAGRQIKFVKWPEKNGKLPALFKDCTDLTGALVLVTITKWQVGRDPTVELLEVVQVPLVEKTEEQSP